LDDDDDDDVQPKTAEARRLVNAVNKRVAKALKNKVSATELRAIKKQLKGMEALGQLNVEELRAMLDADKGVIKSLATQGLALQKLQDKLDAQPTDMSVRAQCQRFIEENKDTIKKIRSGNTASLSQLPPFELTFRAVNNPMLPANTMPSGSLFITRLQIEQGLSGEPLPVPTLWDYIRKGTTNAETYVWVNRKPREGSAAFIAPGVYKPNISFTYDTDISNAKKVAASEKMALELLDDIEGFVDWVETELKNAVLMEANNKLTTGVASSTSPNGIRTISVAFQGSSLGLKVDNPNYWDAMIAVVTQFKAQPRFQGRPVTLFVNPVDYMNARLTKAKTQGQIFNPIEIGATVVEDPNVPLGYIQGAVLDAFKVLIYKPYTMSWGWENDDFTKNLVTVIGEMRIHQFVKDSDAGAFVYDTFANVISGITPA